MYFQTMVVIGVSDIQVRCVGDVLNKGTSFSPEWRDRPGHSSRLVAGARARETESAHIRDQYSIQTEVLISMNYE